MAPQPNFSAPSFSAAVELPFDGVLREVHGRLMTAHAAAVGTLEAELSRMRNENTFLRMKLAEVGVSLEASFGSKGSPLKPHKLEETVEAMSPPALLPVNTSLRAPVTSMPHPVPAVATVDIDTHQKMSTARRSQASSPVAVVGPATAPQVEPSSVIEKTDVQDATSLTSAVEEPKQADDVRGTDVKRAVSGEPQIPDEGIRSRHAAVLTVAPAAVSDVSGARAYLKKEGSPAATTTALLTPIPTTLNPTVSLGSTSARETNPTEAHVHGAVVSSADGVSSGGLPLHAQSVQPHHRLDSVEVLEAPSAQLEQSPGQDMPPTHSISAAKEDVASVERREEEAEIIEVITPGAAAAGGIASTTQDLDLALEAVMAYYGWQHLEVAKMREGMFSLAGSEFMLRCDGIGDQSGEPPYRLSASVDGGKIWESLALLVRNRRLHKVVRTAPVASTREIPPNANAEEGLDYNREVKSATQAPISLADLARMPSRLSQGQPNLSSETYSAASPGGYQGYNGGRNGSSPFAGASSQTFRSKSSYEGVLPLGPDGLPTHLQNGLPAFNNAFPNYFDARSGSTHYYNQFRVPDRQNR